MSAPTTLSLAEVADVTSTGGLWLFRGRKGGGRAIPGVTINGQFLLELNSFDQAQTIQTFAVNTTTVGGVQLFNGFQRDAAGALVVGSQEIGITRGWRLLMGGDLRLLDTLVVNGQVELRRGRKLYPGDRVALQGREFTVTRAR